jgi:hypothetical protein
MYPQSLHKFLACIQSTTIKLSEKNWWLTNLRKKSPKLSLDAPQETESQDL